MIVLYEPATTTHLALMLLREEHESASGVSEGGDPMKTLEEVVAGYTGVCDECGLVIQDLVLLIERKEKIEALEASLEGAQTVAGQLMQVARRSRRLVDALGRCCVNATEAEYAEIRAKKESLRRALVRVGYGENPHPKEREGA